MATFEDRFGAMGELPAFPADPNERKRIIDKLRSDLLMESVQQRGNRVAKSAGYKFKVPKDAEWSVEPDAQGPAAANTEPSQMVIPELDAATAGARNQAAIAPVKFSFEEAQPQTAPTTPEVKFSFEQPQGPQVGQGEALARSAKSGATLGWGEEIDAASKASGLKRSVADYLPGPTNLIKPAIGAARLLYEKAMGPGTASETYDKSVSEDRARREAGRKQWPGTSLAGEIAGGLAVPLPGATTGTLGRVALKGAGYGLATGAISAAGESENGIDPTSTAIGGGIGAGIGGTLPYVGRLASVIAGRPINTIRNLFSPTGGAERAVGQAAQDADRIAAREAAERARRGLPPEQEHRLTTAQMQAEPEAMMLDTLGQPGRDLARSATNVSSEAHGTLAGPLAERAAGRSRRGVEHIEGEFGPTPSAELKDRVISEGRKEADPLYQFARDKGNYDLTQTLSGGKGLNQLLERSPALRRAATDAERNLQNRYASEGGWEGTHNLEYWDMVKRGLDDQISAAQRNAPSTVGGLASLKNAIVERLDRQVPGYAQARAAAADYIGSGKAVEAGEKLYGKTQDTAKHVGAINALGPGDKRLATQGLMDRVKAAVERDPAFWEKYHKNNGGIRTKLEGVLNPQELGRLEARSHLERVMQSSKEALGNSTTARQLGLRGLATVGGAGLAYGGGDDYSDYGKYFSAASLAQLARKGGDVRVANRIAQLLRSNDPAVLDRAAQAFAKNERVMQTLRLMTSGSRDVTGREVAKAQARKKDGRQ